jgi:catechol 2,3-dioxygenase-like lactoylglutathione lyase family enzyme
MRPGSPALKPYSPDARERETGSMTKPAFSLSALHQVALPSADLARSIAFYRDQLGADLIASFDPPGLAFFRLGEVRLLVESADGPSRPGGGALYFAVPDIARAHAALAARGVAFDSAPHLIHRDEDGTFGAPAEEWMAFFRDPDGNVLALAERRPLP